MKKLISIFTVIIMLALVFNCNTLMASDVTPEDKPTVNLTYDVKQEKNQVIFSISLGNFEGVEENCVMTAMANLDFYNNQIKTIEGKAYGNWKVTVSADTKTALFETDVAKPNTKIGEVIFNLDTSNITETTQGVVAINDLNISDGLVLDEVYSRNEFTYVIEPEVQEPDGNTNEIADDETTNDPDENESTITEPDKSESGTTSGDTSADGTDTTISPDEKLPQTGISIAIVASIILVTVLAIIGIIKYKTIKIK